MVDVCSKLATWEKRGITPAVTAFNRIDGPGSSLDLREFQEALWRTPPEPSESVSAEWTRGLPRTVGMTIDIGCRVTAHPLEPGQVAVISKDYGYQEQVESGKVPFETRFWLLKILDLFGLSGVRLVLHNLVPGIKSSGLGGSATATTAVCLMANRLSATRFGSDQIVAMASMIEQDMGVSITGTQEQANVVYGGVTDYVWFPWGSPGSGNGFGTSKRYTLLQEEDYADLEARIRIYHSGRERSSTDVNSVFRERLRDAAGFELHHSQLDTAYCFREGLRVKEWGRVRESIKSYRAVRQQLCSDYMTSECWDIQGQCEQHDAESFPLGAGGGGAVMIFATDPEKLDQLDRALGPVFRRIDYKLRGTGHEFHNWPDDDRAAEPGP